MSNCIRGGFSVVNNTGDEDWNHAEDADWDGGLAVEEEKPKLKPPKQYKVIVNNDDYTPMEFVVQVLKKPDVLEGSNILVYPKWFIRNWFNVSLRVK